MFLDTLLKRNFEFMIAAARLHQEEEIDANSYAIDLDAVTKNAKLLSTQGESLGLEVLAMTKQMGRNPDFCKAVHKGGIQSAVAVDYECGVYTKAAMLDIAHIGHLVQIPRSQISRAFDLEPKLWTVFSLEQAKLISNEAKKRNIEMRICIRVWDESCIFYKGHEGGFHADQIIDVATQIAALGNLVVAGVTSFPALLFDVKIGKLQLTNNSRLISEAAGNLESFLGYSVIRNMPGTTSVEAMEHLARAGATQVEPGHGLTGTTPLSAVQETPELPAVAYVTEVMHHHQGKAYVLGGGLYRDPVLGDIPTRAAVFGANGNFDLHLADMPGPGAIDYYASLAPNDRGNLPPVGATVIFGFRPQAFVSRGMTVGVHNAWSTPQAMKHYSASGAKTLVRDGGK
jgi:predicted amino acid racemase